ncbi:MAG: protein-glutamate O-methyltransferase CheR [Erythrobacter sp.]
MEVNDASHQIIADLLADRTGQQLTESRRWRIGTALSGLFRERGIDNLDQLVCLLGHPDEKGLEQEIVEALLNNETYFFRDKPTFDQLPDDVVPQLAKQRAKERKISIWCAGCSTGQEAYSLAMQFADQPERWSGWRIEILGTDISQNAITTAQRGVYSQFQVQRGLGVGQMLSHFHEVPDGWEIKHDTVSNVRFRQHNLLGELPLQQKFDLILCRNVLLYFDAINREKAFQRLHSVLANDGYLMLGAGETVVGQTSAFSPSRSRASIYVPAGARPVDHNSLPIAV